jgi:hypothetical protein
LDYLGSISTLTALDYAVLALACWRLAFAITKERGPFAVFATLRERWPLGGLTTCQRCASFWTALLMLALYLTPLRAVVVVLAVSGLALMAASYTGVQHGD